MQATKDNETAYAVGSPGAASDRRVALWGRRAEVWRQHLIKLSLICSDLLVALFSWGVAHILQNWLGRGALWDGTFAIVVSCILVWVGLRALLGLYPGYGLSQVEELRRQTYALLATGAITMTFAMALHFGQEISRIMLFSGLAGLFLLSPLMRQFVKHQMLKSGLWGKPVVILSSGEYGESVVALLNREWGLGFRPAAVFSGHPNSLKERFVCVPDDDSLGEAKRLSRDHGIDTVILAMPHTRREKLAGIVSWASLGFRHVTVIPNLDGITNSAVIARDIGGTFGVEIRHNLLDPSVRRFKRALDLAATLAGGVFILPLIAVISLLIFLESGGPVFYRAKRMGRDGKLFSCIKFRTMALDAEAALERLLEENPQAREEYATYHKLRYDPRVTRVGRFLRKASLDELPQLWNVIQGNMSLVGPRPYLPRESDDIGDTQSEILRVYPGITGPWQVDGRNHTSFAERVGMDAYYVRNWSIWLDLVILVRTVKAVLPDRGAY